MGLITLAPCHVEPPHTALDKVCCAATWTRHAAQRLAAQRWLCRNSLTLHRRNVTYKENYACNLAILFFLDAGCLAQLSAHHPRNQPTPACESSQLGLPIDYDYYPHTYKRLSEW